MAKRSQLVVGEAWAYKRGRQHEHSAYSNYEKVIIESVEPYKASRYGGNIRQTGEGLGVLVSIHSKYQGKPTIQKAVVQLSQLWKPWAEYEVAQAEFEVQYQINQVKAKIAKAEREKFQKEVYQPALKEFVKLIEPLAPNKYISGWTRIEELPVEVLQALTKAIQEKAVA